MEQKSKNRIITLLLSVIIIVLLLLLIRGCNKQAVVTGPQLGKPGTEYFNQDVIIKKTEGGKIGVSIPASVAVNEGKALITVRNTGEQSIVPYTIIGGREVYRASKVLAPGDRVAAVIPAGDSATACITYVETLTGEKFSVTTRLVRGGI
jgi:hypothetical protein